jgi:hypothetical protein
LYFDLSEWMAALIHKFNISIYVGELVSLPKIRPYASTIQQRAKGRNCFDFSCVGVGIRCRPYLRPVLSRYAFWHLATSTIARSILFGERAQPETASVSYVAMKYTGTSGR